MSSIARSFGHSCRKFLKDVPVEPSGAVTSVLHKLIVLLCVSKTKALPSVPHIIAEVAAAAVAACCALCDFTSPCRSEVLAALGRISVMGRTLEEALGRPSVLQRAEEMLPGACSSLMLTIIEAHLVIFGPQTAAGQLPFLASNCAVLSGSGSLLGPVSDSIWEVVYLMLPTAAACTAAPPDSSPHALDKKCLLAALLKAAAGSEPERLSNTAMPHGFEFHSPDARLKPVIGPFLQMALDLEQLLQGQDLLQQRQPDPATALANCLAVFSSPPVLLLFLLTGQLATLGSQPVDAESASLQFRQLLQLHSRTLQRVAEAPLSAGSPWPMVCAANRRMARVISCVFKQMPIAGPRREEHELPLVRQYLDTLRQLCSTEAELTAAQRMGLADGLLAINALVVGLVLERDGNDEHSAELLTFSNPNMLALALMQREVLWFLAAKDNMRVLNELLPMAFMAQCNGLVGGYLSTDINDKPKPTRRRLLALIMQHCSNSITSAIHVAALFGHLGGPMPVEPDMLALLAATAAWPLEGMSVDVPEVTELHMEHSWIAAEALLVKLSDAVAITRIRGRTPWKCCPDALAGCAVALLAFAQYAGMIGTMPSQLGIRFSPPMQTAQQAAAWLRGNPTAVVKLGPPPNDVPEAVALVRLLGWLAEPTTPVATASAVLAEALPALEHRVRSRPPMRQLLEEAGGRWEWAPVAAALHRRLPRRMAARFLPEVDCVTAAVAGSSLQSSDAAAVAAADAATASLLLASQFLQSSAANGACVLIRF